MANKLFNSIKKLRFLIVAALVMAIMSAPFVTQAGSKHMSSATVTDSDDTIAGLGTIVEVQADRYEPVEVAITKPNGAQVLLESMTDSKGYAYVNISDYHLRTAGDYTVEARHLTKNEAYGPLSTFQVVPGTVSETESEVSLSKSSANLGETVQLNVELKDKYGNPIDGHVLKVLSSKKNVDSYSPKYATNEDGEMTFYLTGDRSGITELTVLDSSTNKTLANEPKLAFLDSTYTYADAGGSLRTIWLASESGPIDALEITGLADEIAASESQTITLTALDEDGLAVTDYLGTVRFSSTDGSATLPGDYTFTEDDQGEHTFSLSVKFLTPGEQTLTLTDVDNPSVEGTYTFTVLTEEDYDEDFETEDFEREGEFTLISPASGSYSTDDVEVQGEADYGYYAVIYMNEEEAGRTEVEFDNSFTYTLQNIEDGTYVVYVDIVELDDSEDYETGEIIAVIESSDSETIEVDTTAPEVISISSDPETAEQSEVILITVLSEENLENASLLFEDELYEMNETATSGKYEVEITVPAEDGEYPVDVILMDQLGNEAQHRDQLSIVVGEGASSETDETSEIDDDESSDEYSDGYVGQVTGVTTTSEAGTVYLSWESAESAAGVAFYRVYYGPSSEALYALSETYDSSTSWSIPGLSAGTYYFSVAAIDVDGNEGALSNVVAGNSLEGESTASPDADVPTGTSEPEITSSGTPDSTPDTGPAQTALFLLSLIATAAIFLKPKKVNC